MTNKINSGKQIAKDKSSFSKAALPFVMTASVLAGFVLGILVIKFPDMVRIKSDNNQTNTTTDVSTELEFLEQSSLEQVYGYLKEIYINELPPNEELNYGVIKGIINSLNDPYTSYLTPEEAKVYLQGRTGDFEGIGITLAFDGENTYVETVLEGFPASKNGIKVGDVIVEVDGEDQQGKEPQIVASKIRGQKGTEVKLKVYRTSDNPNGEVKEFAITREKIDVDNVTWKDLGNGQILIDISQFSDESPDVFNNTWDKVVADIIAKEGKPKSIIVDLRNNPGGFVVSVRHTLEEFLPNGTTMMAEQVKSQDPKVYKDFRVGQFEDIPLSVIVNEGSASAAEIFATGIMENNRGEIVGKPTVGKGVEQIILDDFEDGSILLLVFQKWLTPNGNNITKEAPVKPDFEVEYTQDDFDNGSDPQLEKAKEVAAL